MPAIETQTSPSSQGATTPALTPALTLAGVSHRYGNLLALDGVELEVQPGEVVCLLGPSGCGKTTALRVAAGLEDLQTGSLKVDGRVVADGRKNLPPEHRGVGFVFQDYALFPHLSVLENVMFGLPERGGADRRRTALSALEKVGMDRLAAAYPHILSGGQQQRVALARALAPEPRVLLLDEPYSGLDARLRDRVRDEVLHLLKESGAATLMVTHDSEEAMFMADTIAVMREGKVVQRGTPTELYCQPVSPFVAAFFGEVNELDGQVQGGEVRTVLGDLPAGDQPEGAAVKVVVRPEAMGLHGEPFKQSCPLATVVQSRLLGRTSLVHLSIDMIDPASRENHHFHARMPGVYLPEEGRRVCIDLDLSQAFVFGEAEA
ncbi:MAG: ABC transporter ATP-binding protein [Rhodospirillaceae bacterium]|nr:ABC transporter ATP-binding protein [Rhodospirillaceae bacterium]MBT6136302.1 ABC transporter ATP-binding protein [Rhodospirillaceae bacterium]